VTRRLGAGVLAYLRGAGGPDRMVPRASQPLGTVALLAALIAFGAVLALGLAVAATRLAEGWQDALADAATLQVFAPEDEIESQARAALDVLRATPGVRSVRMVDLSEQERLLAPWLGPDIPVESLPLPLLIEVEADRDALDEAALLVRLQAEAPGAVYDDHAAWRAPLVATAERLRTGALAALAFAAATLAAVLALAVQASVAANGRVVEALRLVGAEDRFISRAFTRGVTLRAAAGAAAGTAAAAAVLAMLPPASARSFFPVGIRLEGWHWALPLLVPPAAALIAWAASRATTRRHLRAWS
jgi:cell division transport system permease protein